MPYRKTVFRLLLAILPRAPATLCLRLLRQYQRELQHRAAMLAARAFREKPNQMVARVESLGRAANDRHAKERRQTWRRAA